MSVPRIGSLCTGYGGLDLAAQSVFGGGLSWWSDIEPGPIAVMSRHHPDVPNLGDIRAADWEATPPVDILTAGYPCQPFSNAGTRLGTEDPRHLWPWISQGIGALRPRIIILENVSAHLTRGADVVLNDLTSLGYDIAWAVVRASDVGAPHQRARLFIVATDTPRELLHRSWSNWQSRGLEHPNSSAPAADAEGIRRRQGWPKHAGLSWQSDAASNSSAGILRWGHYAPAIHRWERITGRIAPDPTVPGARTSQVLSPYLVEWMMGLPAGYVTQTPGLTRNQMLKLLGNGVVPLQAEHAISGLYSQYEEREAA